MKGIGLHALVELLFVIQDRDTERGGCDVRNNRKSD